MNHLTRLLCCALLTCAVAAVSGTPSAGTKSVYEPLGLYLTWQRDPSSTMTIDWHSLASERRTAYFQYRLADRDGWKAVLGENHGFPFSDRVIHRVELDGLEPTTEYEFRFGSRSRVYRFRTMPRTLDEPIRFAVGGDVRRRQEWMERTNRAAMAYDPDFIVWAGDLAYADALPERVDRWHEFFDAIKNTLIDEDGRVAPILSAIGNHEVLDGTFHMHEGFEPTNAWREQIAPYYFALFAFPGQPGYNVLDFGDYMSIILLDTEHSNPMAGAQTEWFANVLEERMGRPHVFPVYHVPAYPSHRPYTDIWSTMVRDAWIPLIEDFGVELVFEAHDHTYKRTHPILGGEVHPEGVVYMGDGAWGVSTREVEPEGSRWYLADAQSKRHFILVTLDGDDRLVHVVDEDGVYFDSWPPALPAPPTRLGGTDRAISNPVEVEPQFADEDVNRDGTVNALDIQIVINAVLGLPIPDYAEPDVSGNGRVDAMDIQRVINAVLGTLGSSGRKSHSCPILCYSEITK